MCGGRGSLTHPWPPLENEYLIEDTVNVVVQINGKRRAEIECKVDTSTGNDFKRNRKYKKCK